MQIQYFSTAWNDVKNSPGWLKKTLLLSLLLLIPIFGAIVYYGYLFGWARDVAWGVRKPLPQRIFGNEDGKLYSRGFFIMVLSVVFSIVLMILSILSSLFFMGGTFSFLGGESSSYAAGGLSFALGGILSLAMLFLSLASFFFLSVGYMRISIYGRLSPGFQFRKIWKMIRHDFTGLLKIFGMVILLTLIVSIGFQIVYSVLIFVAAFSGTVFVLGATNAQSVDFAGIIVTVILLLILFAVLTYVLVAFCTWIMMLEARALGYWTSQFDVPHWRGEDDPMPFELQQAVAAASPPSVSQYQSTGAPTYSQAQPGAPMQPAQAINEQVPPQSNTTEQVQNSQGTPPAQTPPVHASSSEDVLHPPLEQAAATQTPSTPLEGLDKPKKNNDKGDEAPLS